MTLKIAAKNYIQRIYVIWSSQLSEWKKVKSTNEIALSTFMYLMWTQRWPLAELKQIDRRVRKIIVAIGGRHPTSSNATPLPAKEHWRRRLKVTQLNRNTN